MLDGSDCSAKIGNFCSWTVSDRWCKVTRWCRCLGGFLHVPWQRICRGTDLFHTGCKTTSLCPQQSSWPYSPTRHPNLKEDKFQNDTIYSLIKASHSKPSVSITIHGEKHFVHDSCNSVGTKHSWYWRFWSTMCKGGTCSGAPPHASSSWFCPTLSCHRLYTRTWVQNFLCSLLSWPPTNHWTLKQK